MLSITVDRDSRRLRTLKGNRAEVRTPTSTGRMTNSYLKVLRAARCRNQAPILRIPDVDVGHSDREAHVNLNSEERNLLEMTPDERSKQRASTLKTSKLHSDKCEIQFGILQSERSES